MNRLVIYTKDVVITTGKTERQARYLLEKIKTHLQKEKHQSVTITEYCYYMGFTIEETSKLLRL
jgi:ribosomal silencing factor RsfS